LNGRADSMAIRTPCQSGEEAVLTGSERRRQLHEFRDLHDANAMIVIQAQWVIVT